MVFMDSYQDLKGLDDHGYDHHIGNDHNLSCSRSHDQAGEPWGGDDDDG